MSAPTTVLIADDSEIVRKGIRTFLDSEPDFKVIGEAESGREAIEVVVNHVPDIVILDISMPDD